MTLSLRAALSAIGLNGDVRVPADLQRPRPSSLRKLGLACRDPLVAQWTVVGKSWGVNTGWSEEAQGAATDGGYWFISTNADDSDEGIYALNRSTMKVAKHLAPPFDPDDYHVGALCVRDGVILAPVQGAKRGVWVTDTDLTSSWLAMADHLPFGDMFAWCDVNPHNGLVYTADFTSPTTLVAYELTGGGLVSREESNIKIVGASDGSTTRVQGGCFTPNFKWLAACDVEDAEEIQCFSTLTGHLLGRRSFHPNVDEITVRNEFEGIWYYPFQGSQVHVLELDNDIHSDDDMYLWHLSLPGSDLL